MPAFKDANNREWLVKIDAPKIREVRERLKLDLVASDGSAFEKLGSDPVLLVDCLWVLVSSQRPEVTDIQFGESLTGDSLEQAAQALTSAALDFFRPAQRSLLRSLDEKETDLRTKAVNLVQAKINDPALERDFLANIEAELDKGLSQMLKRSPATGAPGATSSPESAESAPPA